MPSLRCPGRVKPGVSDALVCQVDFAATFAARTGQAFDAKTSPDSQNILPALLANPLSGAPSSSSTPAASRCGKARGNSSPRAPAHAVRVVFREFRGASPPANILQPAGLALHRPNLPGHSPPHGWRGR